MCLSYAWQYKCGCIAPKLSENPIHRCSSWEYRRSCEPKQLYSYLDVDCSASCCWEVGNDKAPRQQEDWSLQNGPYQGEPSEEDYFLHRVPPQLNEPISVRRYGKRQATAARQRAIGNSEDRAVVVLGVGKEVESSDGEASALDPGSDIVVDESKPEKHYVSQANFGGRFSRRKQ